jgi:hypothetical protein
LLCIKLKVNYVLQFEDGDAYDVTNNLPHCFTVYGANRSIILAANSNQEKLQWLDDLARAVRFAKESRIEHLPESATIKSPG